MRQDFEVLKQLKTKIGTPEVTVVIDLLLYRLSQKLNIDYNETKVTSAQPLSQSYVFFLAEDGTWGIPLTLLSDVFNVDKTLLELFPYKHPNQSLKSEVVKGMSWDKEVYWSLTLVEEFLNTREDKILCEDFYNELCHTIGLLVESEDDDDDDYDDSCYSI